jgi:hypothetical protein
MTFKLEDIKVEGNKEQNIVGNYSFDKKHNLRGDRTFCSCEEYEDWAPMCICNYDTCTID